MIDREMDNQSALASSKWIWAEGSRSDNSICYFRKIFSIQGKVKKPVLRIAADTHYFVNINNQFVVWEGGINRSPSAPNGYYDEIDVSKYVKKGENIIVVVCHYNHHDGRGLSGGAGHEAGMILELTNAECPVLVSDKTFTVYRNESFAKTENDTANVNYPQDSYTYDATVERPLNGIYLVTYKSNMFVISREICLYGEQPFGRLERRNIPRYAFNSKLVTAKKIREEKDAGTFIYKVSLPRAMFVYPSISFKAAGMEKIRIYTDRATTFGGHLDHTEFHSPDIHYICKAAAQNFDSFVSVYGQTIYFEIPKSVKLSKIQYRYREYNFNIVGNIETSDSRINAIAAKCINTLKVSIGDTIYNNVERDRALTLDSANIAVKTMLKVCDESARDLILKIFDDVLANFGSTATPNLNESGELEAIGENNVNIFGLLTASELGMLAAYSDCYGDMDARFLEGIVNYLKLWNMDGALVQTVCEQIDTQFNVDNDVIENALYYSALVFASKLSERLQTTEHDEFIQSRLKGFKSAFHDRYFNGIGFCTYADFNDERANAIAVLVGLSEESENELMSEMLLSIQNSSPYFDGYVLQALAKLGKADYMKRRISIRYADAAASNMSTMGEEFYFGGAATSVRSILPLVAMIDGLGGVSVDMDTADVTITPDLLGLEFINFATMSPRGLIRGEYKKIGEACEYTIYNDTKQDIVVNLNATKTAAARTEKISKGKYKFTM